LITTQYSVTLCLNGMKVNDIPSWLWFPRIWCIELCDMSNIPLQASPTSVCNKCSKSTLWEDFELL
jgi:hypothetical protein